MWTYLESGSLQIKLEWGHLVGPQSNRTGIPIRGGNWDTDTHRRKVIWSYREKMAICKPRREAWARFSLSAFKGHQPSQHLNFRLLPLELCDHIFLLFKPLSLWHFTPAALANYTVSQVPSWQPFPHASCQAENRERTPQESWEWAELM